jgi:hypothetical protein
MQMKKRPLALVFGAVLLTSFGAAQAAQADPWPRETGKGPTTAAACNYVRPPEVPPVQLGNGAVIELRYGGYPGCRRVVGHIYVPGKMPSGSNCYVKVENTRGEVARAAAVQQPVPDEFAYAAGTTASIDDAGILAWAWGYCKLGSNGTAYTGQTKAY